MNADVFSRCCEGATVWFRAEGSLVWQQLVGMLQDALRARVGGLDVADRTLMVVVEYIATTVSGMIAGLFFEEKDWNLQAVCPYLAPFLSQEDATAVCKLIYAQCYKKCVPKETQEDEHDEGEDLCNCEFSLGYGAKILLNNTRLHLKRGKRYGVCGHNGCGKSTLMKAIANGQVENFPPPSQLKTVYVEHDIQVRVCESSYARVPSGSKPGPKLPARSCCKPFARQGAPTCIVQCVSVCWASLA